VNVRGYPVICIINRHGTDVQFNHAVVVTGFSRNTEPGVADIVYYLDPSAKESLLTATAADFEQMWARGDRAMMLVVAPPEEAASAPSPGPGRPPARP
jgi:hypothetical protein